MKLISLRKGKRKIEILWLSFFLVILLILVIQTASGMHIGAEKEVWGWFMQNLIPSLSLIFSVFALNAFKLSDNDKEIEKFYFRISFWLSFLYLSLVLFPLLWVPLTDFETPPISTMNKASFWLTPLQGLVTASLGIFFVKKTVVTASKGNKG